jgi:Ead/Ea22-like protein
MKLTQEQLEAIRQRAENATPGPWETCEISKLSHAKWFGVLGGESDDSLIDIGVDTLNEADATFIAHARTDIPALLDYIAELEAELARLKDALIEISELSDEFFNVEVIDDQPTFVLKEGLEAYSDIIHEIAIVSNEAVNGKEDDQ